MKHPNATITLGYINVNEYLMYDPLLGYGKSVYSK